MARICETGVQHGSRALSPHCHHIATPVRYKLHFRVLKQQYLSLLTLFMLVVHMGETDESLKLYDGKP
jgi:hypothetical protein